MEYNLYTDDGDEWDDDYDPYDDDDSIEDRMSDVGYEGMNKDNNNHLWN